MFVFVYVLLISKMLTVRNAGSLATSRELLSGLQILGKRPLNALFSVATMNADTGSASEESVKVIQERVAHGTLGTTVITSRVKFQNSNGKEL